MAERLHRRQASVYKFIVCRLEYHFQFSELYSSMALPNGQKIAQKLSKGHAATKRRVRGRDEGDRDTERRPLFLQWKLQGK